MWKNGGLCAVISFHLENQLESLWKNKMSKEIYSSFFCEAVHVTQLIQLFAETERAGTGYISRLSFDKSC